MLPLIRLKLVVSLVFTFIFLTGCTTSYPNRTPSGKTFPNVTGQSLDGKILTFPDVVKGQETLLLLGYVQNAQFDIDRWLIGLDMTNTQIPVYELPTIQGMLPRFFKTQIDEGMRKGIPKELWKGVVTIYKDGEMIQKFTGNTNPNNARVILLNKQGEVSFFYDGGFSVAKLNQLRNKLNNQNLK